MKKIILLVLAMALTSCASFTDAPPSAPTGYYTEFITFGNDVPDNCVAYSADVYITNGVPALLYMCNKV